MTETQRPLYRRLMLGLGVMLYSWPLAVAALHFDYIRHEHIRDPRQMLPPHSLTELAFMLLACLAFSIIVWELLLRGRVPSAIPYLLRPLIALCWIAFCIWPIGYIFSAIFRVT